MCNSDDKSIAFKYADEKIISPWLIVCLSVVLQVKLSILGLIVRFKISLSESIEGYTTGYCFINLYGMLRGSCWSASPVKYCNSTDSDPDGCGNLIRASAALHLESFEYLMGMIRPLLKKIARK